MTGWVQEQLPLNPSGVNSGILPSSEKRPPASCRPWAGWKPAFCFSFMTLRRVSSPQIIFDFSLSKQALIQPFGQQYEVCHHYLPLSRDQIAGSSKIHEDFMALLLPFHGAFMLHSGYLWQDHFTFPAVNANERGQRGLRITLDRVGTFMNLRRRLWGNERF